MSAPIVLAFEAAWQRMPRELGPPDAIYAHPATLFAFRREMDLQMAHEFGDGKIGNVPIREDRWAPEGDFFPAWDKTLPDYQRRMLQAARGARIETDSLGSMIEALDRAARTTPSRDALIKVWAYLLEKFARDAVRVKP